MFDFDGANLLIGSKSLNCAEFVCELLPEWTDILLTYGNPASKTYNLKKANELLKEFGEEVNYEDVERGIAYLLSFETSSGTSGHVGIYINGYVYHVEEKQGVIGQSYIKVLTNTLRYKKFKFYKIKESENV